MDSALGTLFAGLKTLGLYDSPVIAIVADHVPVILLLDTAGNAGAAAPMQRLPIGSNAGATGSVTVTSKVVVTVPH